ncbi:phytanoyl-CoA dioxygenase family protein [Cytobacillus oceanisediminis]|uniref:phytanoyl-CoA dioxygenase family protein n=1 Tax=Cytobacillus oceanisediminis TaxID=665099 RepID=UPI001C218903|nr:phytanoyl-CoA dioxygenase family protein [Cytobacillus oceanisediminis]MBU8772108.1 phytanoyl-CoA dioxygenase family protein [Cytobacillus oceanisediminis]
MGLLTKEDKIQYERDGYVVLKEIFSMDEIYEMRSAMKNYWVQRVLQGKILQKANDPLASLFPPLRIPFDKNIALYKYMIDPRVFDLVEEIISEEALSIGTTCFFKGPGSKTLPMHQDNYDIGVTPGTTCAVWISIDDTDNENGGLTMVPRTHQLGLLKPTSPGHKSAYAQSVPVPQGFNKVHLSTSPGDVVIFNGYVLHGSKSNNSKDRFRRSMVTHFAGVSTEKIFVKHNELVNKQGEIVKRKLNKRHIKDRLFLE